MRGNHSDIEIGSDRTFGVVMAVAFALLGGISFWRDSGAWPYLWGVSAVFAVPTVLAPHILHPANRLWHAFGLLLGRILNQDVFNMKPMMEGMRASFEKTVQFSNYQETKIRHFHTLLQQWVEKP